MKKWIIFSLMAVLLMTGMAFAETTTVAPVENAEMSREDALNITAKILRMSVEELKQYAVAYEKNKSLKRLGKLLQRPLE